MRGTRLAQFLTGCLVMAGMPWLNACTGQPPRSSGGVAPTAAKADERTCLIRAMYFESNRSSRDGLMAVGTVVMNRVASPRYPNTICGVVGQRGQFAYGVLTSPLDPRQLPPVERAADAILAGERYKPIGDAMWFHVAGLRIPYRVQYMSVAGGNAFYRKTGQRYADIRVAPGSDTVCPTRGAKIRPRRRGAPARNVVERLFARSNAAAPRGQNCDAARAGLGAISLACEDEAAGR